MDSLCLFGQRLPLPVTDSAAYSCSLFSSLDISFYTTDTTDIRALFPSLNLSFDTTDATDNHSLFSSLDISHSTTHTPHLDSLHHAQVCIYIFLFTIRI